MDSSGVETCRPGSQLCLILAGSSSNAHIQHLCVYPVVSHDFWRGGLTFSSITFCDTWFSRAGFIWRWLSIAVCALVTLSATGIIFQSPRWQHKRFSHFSSSVVFVHFLFLFKQNFEVFDGNISAHVKNKAWEAVSEDCFILLWIE